MKISKIISGGQTGADRGGLNAAIQANIPHGGWCPKGRRSEDGVIPSKYHLIEMGSSTYLARTEKNVIESDATVVFTPGAPTGGSKKTIVFAKQHKKPWLHLDLKLDDEELAERLYQWLANFCECTLNIAGSRESKSPGIKEQVEKVVLSVITKLDKPQKSSKQMLFW